jgi:formate hydrogenlyase subunit 6/NADH:ubiquinone oxidoreductase subunit I
VNRIQFESDSPEQEQSLGLFHEAKQALLSLHQGALSAWRALSAALPYIKVGSAADLRKEVTEQYPDPVSSRTEGDLPPRSRGLLFNDIERCTGCRDCERVCPVRSISIETVQVPDSSKAWVSVFDIDFSSCIFCGLCVESCMPGSLVHTRAYERATFETSEMAARFGRGRITPEQRARWERVQRETQNAPVFSLVDALREQGQRDNKGTEK